MAQGELRRILKGTSNIFLGRPDPEPDPLVRGTDPDPAPDSSIIKQK